MIELLIATHLAVVVPSSPPPPPPPATASQQECKYSIRESSDTYVCYSEDEYQAKLAQEAAQAQASAKALNDWIFSIFQWLAHNWWKALLWGALGFVVLIVLISVADSIERKRHPERFDEYGFRKNYWYY